MKVCTCFLLVGTLAYTHCFASNTPESNQRRVNLALETVLEFNNKDKEVDIKFLDNVQNFITKVKTVINENSNGNNFRRNFQASPVQTFTGFIQDVIHILNTYEDTAFADFFDILDKEIRNYHYRGCRFYELTENDEIRKLIAAKLDLIKGKPTSVTKANINALSVTLRDENYDRNVKEIVDYINSLYKQEAGENFQNVKTDLEAYGRSKSQRSQNNLGTIIKNGVRSIIFDHYTNLNSNVRRDAKHKIETFWKQFEKNPQSRGNILNVKPYFKFRNNAKNSETIMNEVKKPELAASRKDLMNIANKKANKKVGVIKKHENNKDRTEIKQSDYKKAKTKRDDVKSKKKRYKHTIKDTVDRPLDIQEKETSLSSIVQQRTKNERQEQANTDSLYDESFSSIEFHQEPQHNTTQYMAIIPEKMSQKQSIKKKEKIEALNVTTRIPINNTVKKIIWIEQSTIRLPKAKLDKLAIKPSELESRHMTDDSVNKHSHKHKKKYDNDQKKWHGKIYEPKYGKKDNKKHGKKRMKNLSKNFTEYKSQQKQKSKQDKKNKYDKTSEPKDPFTLVHNRDFFRQNYVQTTDSVFNMEAHQYKKSKKPLRMELKQNTRRSTASTKAQKLVEVLDILMPSKSESPRARTPAAPIVKLNGIKRMRPTQQTSPSPPTNYSMRTLAIAVSRAYNKRNKMLSWKPVWHFRKSAEYPISFNEGMILETSEIKDDSKRHGQNAKRMRTSYNLETDTYVIERIKNLERQLNEVKSRIDVNTDVVTATKVTQSFSANNDAVKSKQTEATFRLDVNNFLNDYKVREDKLKMAGTADNKIKSIIENKYVKGKDSTKNEVEDDLEKKKKSYIGFRLDVNNFLNDYKFRTDKLKIAGTADNKTKSKIENKYVKGKDSINNEVEDDLEKSKKSDVNMIPNNVNDGANKAKVAGKSDNKTDVKDKKFKNKEEKVNPDIEIEKVTKQQEIIKKDKKPEISLTNIGDVSPKAKDKGIKVMMNDHDGDDASKKTGTPNRKIASLSTSVKPTETTTKTTTTVQPTVLVTTPTTIKLSAIS